MTHIKSFNDLSSQERKECVQAFEIAFGISLFCNFPPIREWEIWKKAWVYFLRRETERLMKIQIDQEVSVEVSFFHETNSIPGQKIAPYTQATVKCYRGEFAFQEYIGYARVHPDDQYCKRIGRRVALTKALAQYCFPDSISPQERREARRAIWTGLIQKGVRFF